VADETIGLVSGLTPVELYDILNRAVDKGEDEAVWWLPGRRIAVWFNVAEIRINNRTWSAACHARPEYGYTLGQARGMRTALLPILAEYLELATAAVAHIFEPTNH
jgi:hypothetical protein